MSSCSVSQFQSLLVGMHTAEEPFGKEVTPEPEPQVAPFKKGSRETTPELFAAVASESQMSFSPLANSEEKTGTVSYCILH